MRYRKPNRKETEEELSHTFLVVLQKGVDPADNERYIIQAYFVDSAPQFYRDVRDYLYQNVRKVATKLNWSGLCDSTGCVEFSTSYPRSQCPDNTPIYDELYKITNYALVELLDWKALVAWLLCRKLIVEQSPDAMPQDRRFVMTQYQITVERLHEKVRGEREEGDELLLFSMTESNYAYDQGTNFGLERMRTTRVESEMMREEEQAVEEEVEMEEKQQARLNRGMRAMSGACCRTKKA
ncbi:hypothetical protein K458DRAFT_383588 [Lentithecium fluviatile CBS 122367]|uniref:Uncharacterized protein n=1 Tax=Lentithecium fluviatile CBS 122367 TaxID=1168545 RepID=A0A6G1JIT3_9PLEO|nr:hypothetical protein K458DRAFT_383588 [Lentithecium fluviatile CBS 122367]